MQSSDCWDVYWRGTTDAAAYAAGGVSHPQIREFWHAIFGDVQRTMPEPRCLDIASGNGAVMESMHSVPDHSGWEATCVDTSEAALRAIRGRFSNVSGIAANAAALPLRSHAFDLVTSQFGAEYAGAGAFDEALRMAAPGGRLAFLAHRHGGSIYEECSRNLESIRRTQESDFLPLARTFFEAGFAAVAGGDRAPYERAGAALDPAVRRLEAIIEEFGAEAAGGMITRLYEDVARIHGAIGRYDASEVGDWLKRLDSELDAFAGRMSSMRAAALDEHAFEKWKERAVAAGFSLQRADALVDPGTQQSLAWALVATRGGEIMRLRVNDGE